jgi:hypothetical protein
MRRRGYVLRSAGMGDADNVEMRWERAGEVALVQMRAATSSSATRINLLVMAE